MSKGSSVRSLFLDAGLVLPCVKSDDLDWQVLFALNCLDSRSKNILVSYYYDGLLDGSISKRYGISRFRIRAQRLLALKEFSNYGSTNFFWSRRV